MVDGEQGSGATKAWESKDKQDKAEQIDLELGLISLSELFPRYLHY